MRAPLLLGLLFACSPSDEDLQKNLKSPNPVVREDTAKIARNYGSEVVRAALIEVLADPSPTVRRNAVDSLAELEAVEAVPALVAMLPNEADPTVQRQIIDALGRLKDPAAVPVLLEILAATPDKPPANVIWALGNIGDGRALDALSALRVTEDPIQVWTTTAALRTVKGTGEAPAEGAVPAEGEAPAEGAPPSEGAPPATP